MNLTMTGVVFERPGTANLTQRPVPVPGEDEILVRIAVTGICGTDRAIILGEFPGLPGIILGHEAVGQVAVLGAAVTGHAVGDRVVVNPTSYCLECVACRRGRPAHCSEKGGRELGVDCDGTMTEYLVVHERYVHPIPDDLGFRAAALVEPLACVLNNVRCAGVRLGDRVVVLGAGPIGTLCARVLIAGGARVVLVERDRARARLAREIIVLAAGTEDFVVTRDLDGVDGADVVIDTTGVLAEQALDRVEDGGTVVVMGERQGARASLGLRSIATRGVSIRGAGPYAPADFAEALRLAGTLNLDALVTHVVPLHRYAAAFDLLCMDTAGSTSRSYRAMKVLVCSDPELAAGS